MNLTKIKETYRKIVKFFTNDIWEGDFSELGKIKTRFVHFLRIVILGTKDFQQKGIPRESAALSFFGALAIVPIFAFIMFVSKGFGFDDIITSSLAKAFPTSTPLVNQIQDWASNIISAISSGVFGIVSICIFLWFILRLLMNIEISFNKMWGYCKTRSILKSFGGYLTILILTPFMLALFLFGFGYCLQFIGAIEESVSNIKVLSTNLFWLVFYGIAVLILSLMYKFIPMVKVQYNAALKAALVAGIAFVGLQFLYIKTQLFVMRSSAIYGAFAAIPLFLMWMNISWQIVLYGVMLSNGIQEAKLLEEKMSGKNLY